MSTSQAPTNLSPSYQILFQKQQEHAGLQALRETSANLLEKVEKLAEMSNIMADGGEGESTTFADLGSSSIWRMLEHEHRS